MFRRTKKLLVAVSGGADSLALLLILRELAPRYGFTLLACHFDHQLRDRSKEDTAAVRVLCSGLGIECVTGEGDVRGTAERMKRGIEETAREMRYQFLAFVAEKEGCDAIATGHTRDDQAETVLMRVIRGSGVRGIRGMLPVATAPGSAHRLIRPLLETPRVDTVAICREADLTPLDDESNEDLRYRRNRVRHETLPGLRALNPSITDALVGLAASAREVFAPVEKGSFAVQPQERTAIGAMFALAGLRALQAEALALLIDREASFYHLRPEVNRTRLGNLAVVLTAGTGSVRFGETVVEASCGTVRIGPPLEAPAALGPAILSVPGDTRAGHWVVRIRASELSSEPGSPAVAFDGDSLHGVLKARSLQPGDRMPIRGMNRKVADILVNEKVPAWERAGAVVLADSAGVVALFVSDRSFGRDGANRGLWAKLAPLPAR
ncbi:MAG: tRNA lysidine(34) synthetase TilS [Dehalococcoidia bacterium]|nr:tRNA lysidine(34) synthetase TilS [Dehalococcoidia bacterium]